MKKIYYSLYDLISDFVPLFHWPSDSRSNQNESNFRFRGRVTYAFLRISIFFVLGFMACDSDSGEMQGSLSMEPDTLIFQTDVRFLPDYFQSYTSITEQGQTIFYGFNHTRNTLDRINLQTGEIEVFKSCDPLVTLHSQSSITVNNRQLITQTPNHGYQNFLIDFENNCLNLIEDMDGKSLAGNPNVMEPGVVVRVTPLVKPAWTGQGIIAPFTPMRIEQLPRLVRISNSDSQIIELLEISFPSDIKEKFKAYSNISKPIISLIHDHAIAFIFPFSDMVFNYNFEDKKLTHSSIPGQFIKGEIDLPTKEEDLRLWLPFNSNFFHNFIWDSNRRVFYRIEIKKREDHEPKNGAIFFNHHYISIISETLELVEQIKVPNNCFSIPIPVGDRLYFKLKQNIEEDAVMFVGIPFPELKK